MENLEIWSFFKKIKWHILSEGIISALNLSWEACIPLVCSYWNPDGLHAINPVPFGGKCSFEGNEREGEKQAGQRDGNGKMLWMKKVLEHPLNIGVRLMKIAVAICGWVNIDFGFSYKTFGSCIYMEVEELIKSLTP